MGWWSAPRHDRFTPRKVKWYQLWKRLDGPHRAFGRTLKISSAEIKIQQTKGVDLLNQQIN